MCTNYLNLLDNDLTNLNMVFSEIENKEKVVFYFHGGLSSNEYVKKTLGPLLLNTMFSNEIIGANTHIVFMQYNTAPFQFDTLKTWVKKILRSKIFKQLILFIELKALEKNNKIKENNFDVSNLDKSYEREIKNDYTKENLKDDFLNFDLDENGNKQFIEVSKFKKKRSKFLKWALLKVLGIANIYGVLIKVAIRFGLKTDHGILATVTEEITRIPLLNNIRKLAESHWDVVYQHSKDLWDNNHGEQFLQKLIKLHKTRLENNSPILIDLISHSAGSIPISFLVDKLKEKESIINNILLIAPAVNIQFFEKKIKINSQVFNRLIVYLLANRDEEKDNLIPIKILSNIYPRSLLYFVSGIAEKGDGYSDMTILGMHRYYKNHSLYTSYNNPNSIFGNVQECKNYFINNGKQTFTFITKTDQNGEFFNQKVIISPGASHSGTKLPHKSPELAKDIINKVTNGIVLSEEVDTSNWSLVAKNLEIV